MRKLTEEIMEFFYSQSFVIVSTIDKNGLPHSACKAIIKINQNGRIYLLDVFHKNTYENLKANPDMSITAVNEHKFKGYCLKGRAVILEQIKLTPQIIKAWEDRITSRITRRLLKNIHEEKGHLEHPEALLPEPKYMIVMDVEDVVDLSPQHIEKGG